MNENEASQDTQLMLSIKAKTGYDPTYNEDKEIIVKPDVLGRHFFSKLAEAVQDFPHTFLVNRSFEVVLFKC